MLELCNGLIAAFGGSGVLDAVGGVSSPVLAVADEIWIFASSCLLSVWHVEAE